MKKYTDQDYKNHAIRQDLYLIQNGDERFFKCKHCNRIWPAKRYAVKRNYGCLRCARIKSNSKMIDQKAYHDSAKKFGGSFLKLLPKRMAVFTCHIHGEFKARRDHVLRGSWCLKCSNKNKPSIEYFKRLANERGGLCLDEKYVNAKTYMFFQCSKNHPPFKMTANKVRTAWCPLCRKNYKSQKAVKIIMEFIFNKKFITVRPDWLKLPNGRKMELDGFNQELMIAFEYQGRQHYQWVKHWHKTKQKFEYQKYRDQLKTIKCEENGVKLILIFEKDFKRNKEQLCNLIIKELDRLNIKIDHPINTNEIDLSQAY